MMRLIFQMRTLSYNEIKQLAQRLTSSGCRQTYLLCKQDAAASKGYNWEKERGGPASLSNKDNLLAVSSNWTRN